MKIIEIKSDKKKKRDEIEREFKFHELFRIKHIVIKIKGLF
jgi:hypothetical protein